ncbi:hypothetical protein LT068_18205, partial [Vibrio cholerae]|uniref:hypothetical protein n=1 Tax=Vibrio cholerae TaxID=666 RepID=UPI001E332191
LPFSVILILYMIGLYKTMKAEEREPTRSPAWIESHLSYEEIHIIKTFRKNTNKLGIIIL